MAIPLEHLLGLRRFYHFCKDCNAMSWTHYNQKEIECSRCGKMIPRNKNNPYDPDALH